jgi:hypothetical protein
MKYITNYQNYSIWQGQDGHMEAWMSKGVISIDEGIKTAKDIQRIVLMSRDIEGAMGEIDTLGKKKKKSKYDPYKDPNQTKIE